MREDGGGRNRGVNAAVPGGITVNNQEETLGLHPVMATPCQERRPFLPDRTDWAIGKDEMDGYLRTGTK